MIEKEEIKKILEDVCKENNITKKELFPWIRFIMSGQTKGLDVVDLIHTFGWKEVEKRISLFLNDFSEKFKS